MKLYFYILLQQILYFFSKIFCKKIILTLDYNKNNFENIFSFLKEHNIKCLVNVSVYTHSNKLLMNKFIFKTNDLDIDYYVLTNVYMPANLRKNLANALKRDDKDDLKFHLAKYKDYLCSANLDVGKDFNFLFQAIKKHKTICLAYPKRKIDLLAVQVLIDRLMEIGYCDKFRHY